MNFNRSLCGFSRIIKSHRIQLILSGYDYNTRFYLSKNLNLSEEVQEILAKDDDYFIRHSLSMNPNISEKIRDLYYLGALTVAESCGIK